MNMFKKNGGFTLVELIVVIAILAILAGVAVPAYSGYIERANQAKDLQILSAVYTAAAASIADTGATVSAISVNGPTVTINDATAPSSFSTFMAGNTIPANLQANWSNGKWNVTQYSTASNS